MKRFAAAVLAVAATVPVFAFQDVKQEPPAKPKESRTAYIRRIFEKDRTSYGDACRAAASLVAGQHSDAGFAALQSELAGKGIVDPGWGLEENSPLTKGTLAYMLCKSLGIRGGLTATILGMSRRYALREAIHVGLIASGTTDEHVTGREFIDVVTNAETYKEEGSLDSVRK